MTKTAVAWVELEDAYGAASKVPDLLERVRKTRGETAAFREAVGELCSHVLHQGTIYSASPAAVHEVIAMLAEADKKKKPDYYGLLDGFAEAARQALSDERFIPCHSGGDPIHGAAIRQELMDARAQFASDLNDADAAVRFGAGQLLVAFADAGRAEIELVRQRYLIEPEAEVRQMLFEGLTRVRRGVEDWRGVLFHGLARETDPKLRFPLLRAEIEDRSPASGDPIWHEVVRAFTGSEYSEDVQFFEPIHRLGQDSECALLIEALGQTVDNDMRTCALVEHLLRAAFDDHRTGWGVTSMSLLQEDGSPQPQMSLPRMAFRAIGMLLLMKLAPWYMRWRVRRMVQSKRKGIHKLEYSRLAGDGFERPDVLSELQRRVLTALADCPAAWKFRTNLWSLFDLPDNAEALKQLIVAQ